MSGRDIVDTILQGATVDLLHSLQIAAAPLPPVAATQTMQEADFSAFVDFTGIGCSGLLYLGCPLGVIQLAEERANSSLAKEDWVRELTNQLMGRVKKRFFQFGVALQASLPAPAGNQFLERHVSKEHPGKVYPLRTLRGTVVVVLVATIDHEKLVYCGDVHQPNEGDVILF